MPSPAKRTKRLRLFAGPDGAGKSSVYRAISAQHDVGVYVNAEELHIELATTQGLLLRRFQESLSAEDLKAFYAQHPLRIFFADGFPFKASSDGWLTLSEAAKPSQSAARAASVLADYVRTRLIESGADLACETVLSNPSELTLLRQAKKRGYQVCLYYICVASPVICKQRVAIRVKHGGHGVAEDRIAGQYAESLAQLKAAVALSDRAYLFDNTYSGAALKLEIHRATEVLAHETQLPEWITRHLPPLVPVS